MFQFHPPATKELPRTLANQSDRFWSRIRRGKTGDTVLKAPDGTYRTVSYPTQDQLDASIAVYMGGHVHPVSAEEAASLVAAGYEVEEI